MECAICGLPANQEHWYVVRETVRGGDDPDAVKSSRELVRWFFCGDHWSHIYVVFNEATGGQDLKYEGQVYASI